MFVMPARVQVMLTTERAPDGALFKFVTLTNQQQMQVTFCDWGATWLSCQINVANQQREVILGCATMSQYLQQNSYLGATIGRYANRIAGATICYNGKDYPLTANQNCNLLHGGEIGFDKHRWQIADQTENQVIFTLYSNAGDQGFPGNLSVILTYKLDDDNQVHIDYSATTDEATPINLTNHAYFNLDAKDPVEKLDIKNHTLMVNADYYLPIDQAGIPHAQLVSVVEDDMDLRKARTIGDKFFASKARVQANGYDHAYLLNDKQIAAQLTSSDKKVTLNVYTTKPALQVYTGNFLTGTPDRVGTSYHNYAGVALETQFLPDSPHHPSWPQPSCWLLPQQKYQHHTIYQFIY